jgi:SP family sugar porter-like MFS transporter
VKELGYCLIIMLGSINVGYTIAFASPALHAMKEIWGIDPYGAGMTYFNAVASVAAASGPFVSRSLLVLFKNRRKVAMFVMSWAGTVFWAMMLPLTEKIVAYGIVVRILNGLVMGAFSYLCPMYLAEVSPPSLSRTFGTLHQLGIGIGVALAYLIGGLGGGRQWIPLVIIAAVLTHLLSLLVWTIPETSSAARSEDMIRLEATDDTLFQRKYVHPLVTCLLFLVFQQFTGINAILSNTTEMLVDADVSYGQNYAAALASLGLIFSTCAAGLAMELCSRRVMWLVSFAGCAVIDMVYGIIRLDGVKKKVSGTVAIILIFFFELMFGFGAGPLPWFACSEVFPDSVKPMAMAVCTACYWVLSFVVILLRKYLYGWVGEGVLFLLLGAASVGGAVFGMLHLESDGVLRHGRYDTV